MRYLYKNKGHTHLTRSYLLSKELFACDICDVFLTIYYIFTECQILESYHNSEQIYQVLIPNNQDITNLI